MIADAEQNRQEDARLRAQVDARNELDSAIYQVERRLAELSDAVPVHEKARAEGLIEDARQAIKEEAPLDRLRTLTSELQQILHGLGTSTGAGAGERPAGATTEGSDEDVIDAEFTTD